ncbi:hypothetical protein ALC53_06524 [Atta colombica]|uniref:Syntaxin N-terminal domain-containing protein n=1 Tax=Atta colombica TaxID=520822 RepID=A0A195BF97_9HYME|nr:hypothetical protein ALC53_06524 [Atta colombica]
MIPYDVLSVKPIVFSTFSHVYFDTETICESSMLILRSISKRDTPTATTGFRCEVRLRYPRLARREVSAGSVDVKWLDTIGFAKNSRILSTRRSVSIYKRQILQIQDINSQVAQFRDLLINIGQPRDCPELREKIRKLRRNCVEACKSTAQLVLPHVQSAMDVGIPVDSPNLVLLFYVAQLFLRELHKSKNLISIIPMDMSGYYENRAGPSYIGNVVSQILLCKQIRPDFNEEELCSIRKDSEEIGQLIAELQEFMPQSEADTGFIIYTYKNTHTNINIFYIYIYIYIFTLLIKLSISDSLPRETGGPSQSWEQNQSEQRNTEDAPMEQQQRPTIVLLPQRFQISMLRREY